MSQPCPCYCHPDANPCGKCLNWHKENDLDFQKQFGIGERGNTEPTQPRSAGGNAAPKVEPSDDTLDTILRQFAQMVLATGEMETDPGFLQGAATANVNKARTQLLQYIEGIIGEDENEKEWLTQHWNTRAVYRNKLRAEQRQRLRGKTND